MRATILAVLVGMQSVASAFAADMFLQAREVTVEGVSDIKDAGSQAAARDLAIRNAQRNAIEQVLGTLIESSFSATQRESLVGNKSNFDSTVEDRVYAKSQGFIESQQVLGERVVGDTYRVSLRVVVKAASLQQELSQLQSVLKAANYPKLMLLVYERYTEKNGNKRWIDRPSVVAMVEEQLLNRTFELVAKDAADKQRMQGAEGFAALVGDSARAAELGTTSGADVVVLGGAEVSFTAFNELNDNLYYVAAVVNLRAVSTASGKVLAGMEVVGRGVGASEDLARVAAVKAATPDVVSKLVAGLVQAWQQEAERGKRYSLLVSKVRNYNAQARPLINALKRVENVEQVKEVGFAKAKLELEVIYRGDKSQLLEAIFDSVAKEKKFRRLDKVADRKDGIELTL